jgi:hypothetical protein
MQLSLANPSKWAASFVLLGISIFLIGGCAPADHPPVNHPPAITALEARQSVIGPQDSCVVECIASDPDGDELTYEWSANKGSINGTGATVAWSAPETEGIYTVAVKVADGNGGEATDSITITVKANRPPEIISLLADADWATPSGSLRLKCDAQDPDGDELDYQWSTSGGDISGTGPEVTWTAPVTVGMYDITVVVADGYGKEDTGSITISVAPSSPPVIEDLIVTAEHRYFIKQSARYLIGKATSCQIECLSSAPEGGELSYGWSASGGELSGEGSVVTWTAPNTSGEFTVTVTVSDATGNKVNRSTVFKVVACSACTFGSVDQAGG